MRLYHHTRTSPLPSTNAPFVTVHVEGLRLEFEFGIVDQVTMHTALHQRTLSMAVSEDDHCSLHMRRTTRP